MSMLKADKDRDAKVTRIIGRLVAAHQLQAEHQLDINKSPLEEINLDNILKNAVDITQIDNYNELAQALLEFDEEYAAYISFTPLGSENPKTIHEHRDQFQILLQRFLPAIEIKLVDGRHQVTFNRAKARELWQQWHQSLPLKITLKDLHKGQANLGIVEKFANKTLAPHEWLSQPDIERYLAATGKRGEVHVMTLNPPNIGMALHFEREKHAGSIDPYTIPFILNLGSNGMLGQGTHWVKMTIKVDPQHKTIVINYTDSLKLSEAEKSRVNKLLHEAVTYQEVSKEGLSEKTFRAFPDNMTITTNIVGTEEQRDSWTCGYRALQNLYTEMKYPEDLARFNDAQELSDHICETILENAEIVTDEANIPEEYIEKTPSPTADKRIVNFAPTAIQNELVKLRNKSQQGKVAQEELLKIEAEAKRFADSDIIKQFANTATNLVEIDFKILVNSLMADNDTAKKAILSLLAKALKSNIQLTHIKLINTNEFSDAAADFFLAELDQVPRFTHLEADGDKKDKLEKGGKILAARNQLLINFNVKTFENDEDLWMLAHKYYHEEKAQGSMTQQNRIEYYKRGEKDSRQEKNNTCIVDMGPIWFEKLLQFYHDNRGTLLHTIPEGLPFNVLGRASIPPFNANYLNVLVKHLEMDSAYLAFKSMFFYCGCGESDLDTLIKLTPLLNKTRLKEIIIQEAPSQTMEKAMLEKKLQQILQLVQSHQITTRIKLRLGEQTHETNKLLEDILHATDKNTRELNKKRLQGLSLDTAPTKLIATAEITAIKVKGKIRACKRDPKRAVQSLQVEHLFQAQQQVLVQQQIHSQQQQLVQAQQLRQREESDHAEIAPDNLIDENNIAKNTTLKALHDSLDIRIEAQQIWYNLMGQTGAENIGLRFKATPEAIQEVYKNENHFRYGFNKDNLPKGFFIQRSGDYEVLCFDRFKYIANKNESPLTLNFYEKFISDRSDIENLFVEFGIDRYAVPARNQPAQEYLENWLYKAMRIEDKEAAEKIITDYKTIFDELSASNVKALGFLLKQGGCVGIEQLMHYLQQIKMMHEDSFYQSFKRNFLDNSDNWMELVSDDALTALKGITTFSPEQRTWWTRLTTQHIENSKIVGANNDATFIANLADLYPAFYHFCEKLNEYKPPVTLPPLCHLENIGNMKVALDRLLTILNNAVNPQEQLNYIEHVKLDPAGAYVASRYQGFNLVTREMELEPEASPKYDTKNFKSNNILLKTIALDNNAAAKDSKKHFFRVLGQQQYRASYDKYLELSQFVENNPKLSVELKRKLYALLAFSTTGADNSRQNFAPIAVTFIDAIIESLDKQKAVAIITALLTWEECKPTPSLATLSAAYSTLLEADQASVSVIAKEFQALQTFDKFGNSFGQSLQLRKKNHEALSLEHYHQFIQKIEESALDTKIKKKLVIIAAVLNKSEFAADQINSVISAITKIDSALANNALEVLSSLDIEQSSELPKLNTIIELFQRPLPAGYNELYAHISSAFPSSKFIPANVMDTQDIDSDEMLKNIDDIIQLASRYITLDREKLAGPDGTKYLMDKILNFENRFPAAVLNKIKNYLIDSHNKKLHIMREKKLQTQDTRLSKLFNERLAPQLLITENVKLTDLLKNLEIRSVLLNNLVDLMGQVKEKFPAYFDQFINTLVNAKGIGYYDLNELSSILHEIITVYQDKPFPTLFLQQLLDHPALSKQEINFKNQQTLTPIVKQLLNERALSAEEKRDLMSLLLNIAAVNGDVADAYQRLLNYKTTQKNYFALIVKFLQREGSFERLDRTLTLTKELVDDKSDTLKLILTFLIAHPNDEAGIKVKDYIQASPPPLALKIFTNTWLNNTTYEVKQLTDYLERINKDDLVKIAALYDAKPQPDLNKLKELWESVPPVSLDKFIATFETDPRGERQDQDILAKQFTIAEVIPSIEAMGNLGYEDPKALLFTHKQQLHQQFLYINAIGHNRKIRVNPNAEPAEYRIIKDMSRQQINDLIIYYRKLVKNDATSADDKRLARLNALALMREVMYRTTGRMPYSTQVLSLLNVMLHGGNVISEIRTGEGKSLTTALFAAMQWFEGQAVDVCTSNMTLAAEGLKENADFYSYLNIPAQLINAASDAKAYQQTGINYSDVAQMSLFQSRLRVEGQTLPENVSLISDESDFTILDDSTQYRYAVSLDKTIDPYLNIYDWLYPLLNEFVESDTFKNKNASAQDDIRNARRYLFEKAKDKADMVKHITDAQLDTWLDSAFAAQQIEMNTELYARVEEKRLIGDETRDIRMARLRIHDRVSMNAQWSNGVQQFLHARLNKQAIANSEKPNFPIDPEKSAVSSISSRNFLDRYRKNGVIWGMTGTIGSSAERKEMREKYGFKFYRVPPHRPSKRVDRTPILAANAEEHKAIILKEIKQHLRQHHRWFWNRDGHPQPMVIICKDVASSKVMYEFIQKELQDAWPRENLQLFNGDPEDPNQKELKEEDVVKKAGVSGMITISTPMLGRGTDFKPRINMDDPGQNHPDGLFVMQTFIDIERTTGQIFGRAGRQGLVGETLLVVNREDYKNISTHELAKIMKLFREKQTISTKQEREAREQLSEIRNHVFEKFLWLLNEIDRNKSELGEVEVKQIRTSLLHQWEHYLDRLDKHWNELIQVPEAKLEDCIQKTAEFAAIVWSKVIDVLDQSLAEHGKEVLSDKKSLAMNANELMGKKAIDIPELPPGGLPYRRLNPAIDINQVCAKINPDVKQENEAPVTPDAIDAALKKILIKLKKYKSITRKITSKSNTEIVEQLLLAILDANYESASNHSEKAEQNRWLLRNTYMELVDIIRWSKDKDLKNAFERANKTHFTSVMASPRTNSGHYLQNRSLAQYRYEDNDLIEAHNFDNWKKLNDNTLWNKTKENALAQLDTYLNGWFLARDRRENATKLKEDIDKLKSPNDYPKLIELLNKARKDALDADRIADRNAILFKRNKNGSHYQRILDDIRQSAIAITESKTLSSQQELETSDIQSLLESFKSRLGRSQAALSKSIDECFAIVKKENDPEKSMRAYARLLDQFNLPQYQKEINSDHSLAYLTHLVNERIQQLSVYLAQTNPAARKRLETDFRWQAMAIKALQEVVNTDDAYALTASVKAQYPSTQNITIPAGVSAILQPDANKSSKAWKYFHKIWYNLPSILHQFEQQILQNLGENTAIKFGAPEIKQIQSNSAEFTLSLNVEITSADGKKQKANLIFQINPEKQEALCDWPELAEVPIPPKSAQTKPELKFGVSTPSLTTESRTIYQAVTADTEIEEIVRQEEQLSKNKEQLEKQLADLAKLKEQKLSDIKTNTPASKKQH